MLYNQMKTVKINRGVCLHEGPGQGHPHHVKSRIKAIYLGSHAAPAMAYANSIAFALQQDPRLPTSVPRGESIISVSSSSGLLLVCIQPHIVGRTLVHVRGNAGCDFRAIRSREKGRDSAVARVQGPSVACHHMATRRANTFYGWECAWHGCPNILGVREARTAAAMQ